MRKTDHKNIYWLDRYQLYEVEVMVKRKLYMKKFKLLKDALKFREEIYKLKEI